MSIGPEFGQDIWLQFMVERDRFIKECRYGDQEAIERIYPFAFYLQDNVPAGFFVGYRDIKIEKPAAGASVIVFAGNNKPGNYKMSWIQEAWQ